MTATISSPQAEGALTGRWTLDPIHSALGFSVTHMMVTRFRGAFSDYDAELVVRDAALRLAGSARVASIATADEKLTGHLQTADFFDADSHPELTFASDGVAIDGDRVTADGSITMRGVTRPIQLAGTVSGPVTDAYGNQRLGLDLDAAVDRTEFGIEWNAPLPGGGVALSNKVRITASLAFVQQEA
jgi:polyisoprenoid-binding protein YceI